MNELRLTLVVIAIVAAMSGAALTASLTTPSTSAVASPPAYTANQQRTPSISQAMRQTAWVAVRTRASSGSTAGRGRPDPAFGNGRGWVTTRIPGADSVAYSATVLRDGGIVVAGQKTNSSGDGQILVVRYRRDGRLDQAFGSRGIFETSWPAAKGPFIATSVAQDRSTGRFLVAGGYGLGSMLVIRLMPDGRLDRMFGRSRNGYATIPVEGIAQSIVIRGNGSILLGGSNANVNGRPMVVARFSRDGKLDFRFGHRGLAQVLFWNPNLASSAGVTGLATTRDGGVIASAHLDYIGSDGHGSVGVIRLSTKGRLARNFGSRGHVEIAFMKAGGGFGQWFPCAMTVDSRGRIAMTGDGSTGPNAALLTARFNRRGLLDRSFGKSRNGRMVTPGLSNDSNTTCGAASDPSGALSVAVGSTLAQLKPNGSPNKRVGHGGLIKIAKPRNVTINAVRNSGRCRVVLAGSAGNAIYVARFLLPARQ